MGCTMTAWLNTRVVCSSSGTTWNQSAVNAPFSLGVKYLAQRVQRIDIQACSGSKDLNVKAPDSLQQIPGPLRTALYMQKKAKRSDCNIPSNPHVLPSDAKAHINDCYISIRSLHLKSYHMQYSRQVAHSM